MGDNGEEIFFREGLKVEVSSNEEGFIDAWYVATVISAPFSSLSSPAKKRARKGSKNPPRNKYFVEYDTLLDDEDDTKLFTELVDVSFIRPSPPPMTDGGFELYDVVDVYHRDGWWTGCVTKVLGGGSRFVVSFQDPPEEIECPVSDVRIHLDWVGCGKWVRPEKQQVSVLESSNHAKPESLQRNVIYTGETLDIQHASSDAAVNNAENEEPTDGGVNICAAKSKRKKRLRAEGSQAFAKGNEGNKNIFTTEYFGKKDGVGDVMSAKEPRDLQAGSSKAPSESISDKDPPVRELENTIQEIVEAEAEASRIRKKRRRPKKSLGEYQNGTVEGSEEAPEGNASEVDTLDSGAKDATLDNEMPSDDQPLRKWLEGMHSTTVMDKGASNGMAREPVDEASVEHNIIAIPTMSSPVVNSDGVEGMHSTTVTDKGASNGMARELSHEASVEQSIIAIPTMSSPVFSGGVEKTPGLPFAKCSPLWNSVESLEVFQKTPQKPHFSPLVKCSENSREGLAIGHMVTFANLVERTSKLQLSDPQSIIDGSLVTLDELKNHGFSVEVVRGRLKELQDLKFRLVQVEEEEKEAEAKIEKLNLEKAGIDEVITLVEERMKQIQQKLAAAASTRDDKVEKIGAWKLKLDTAVQLKENVKHDFEKITDSIL